MQLLLLISALLASLTGAAVGARTTEAQPVEAAAGLIAATAETAVESRRQVQPENASAPLRSDDEPAASRVSGSPQPFASDYEQLLE